MATKDFGIGRKEVAIFRANGQAQQAPELRDVLAHGQV